MSQVVMRRRPPPGLSRWSDDSALQPSASASRRPRRACLGGANDCPLGIPGGQSWAPPRQARRGPDVSTFRRVVQNHASTGTSPAGGQKSSRDAKKQNVSSTKNTKENGELSNRRSCALRGERGPFVFPDFSVLFPWSVGYRSSRL